ncbi:uncharacterized protein B0J16DRAFT_392598 [Fusarium flagelliforme]|uniref:uncharacterized protein n=1 Tax=Fusarium flagelliforme TaxID=2675880 RepID=UPI001E8EA562|nr:uncharacterized protein B0J16DRAFT_392598 [Fusarium flagelliforme]KAH7198801.1 hypothetical protein B0J16DRAFT_392598 [Fusarium flagelliforme]
MAAPSTSTMPPLHYPPYMRFDSNSDAEFRAHLDRLMASGDIEDLWYLVQNSGYYKVVQIFPRYRNTQPRPTQRVCQGGNDCFNRPGPERTGKMSDLEAWFQLGPVAVSIYDYHLPLPISPPVTLPCSCPPATSPDGRILDGPKVHSRPCNANTRLNGWYVATLNPTWVSQCGNTSGHWYGAPAPHRRGAAGVKGLYGCTAIIIVSEAGAYISHIWESPAFVHRDHKRKRTKEIEENVWNALRDGTERGCVLSITSLVGTHQSPGPLHPTKNPRVVIVTPWRLIEDGDTRRELRHGKAVKVLRKGLESFFSGGISEVGYHATDEIRSTEVGFLGRAVVEFDMAKPGIYTDHNGSTWPRGRWRVWVEDKIVARHEFNIKSLATPLYGNSNAQSQPEPSRFCWCILIG